MPFFVLSGLVLLAFFFPQITHVVFSIIPAVMSVLSGESAVGDVRYIEPEPVLTALAVPQRDALLAQASTPVDAMLVAQSPGAMEELVLLLQNVWATLVPVSVFFSLLFGMGALYAFIRIKQIRAAEYEKLHAFAHPPTKDHGPGPQQKRWQKIVEHVNTENENDWRHAIIEADIILDELLDAQGYRGDTMGDKLKQVERSDFNTIDAAWEAHKVRNKIAHEGSALSLNAREARRVIALFEQVFREFHVI